MKKYKEHKKFKREYIPVIIAFLILIGLVTSLVLVIKNKKTDFEVKIDEKIEDTDEIAVDTKNTKCNNELSDKLKASAKNVNISYMAKKMVAGTGIDLDTEGMPEVDLYDYGFEITIKGISEDVYVVVKNDYSTDVFTYHYSDTENGTKVFQSFANDDSVTFTFEIKSENENCKDEVYRKVSLTTPIYNGYSEMEFCKGKDDLDICKQFTVDKITNDDFVKGLENYNNKNNNTKDNTDENNKTNIFKENKYVFIIGGTVIVIIGVATAWIQIKKKRSKQI